MKINFTFLLLLGMPLFSSAQNTCATALPITAGTYVVTAVDGTEFPNVLCSQNGL
jgi:hypothetical protein